MHGISLISWMHLTSSASFQHAINYMSLYVMVSRHPRLELKTSSFPFLLLLLHPRNKLMCALALLEEVRSTKKICSRGLEGSQKEDEVLHCSRQRNSGPWNTLATKLEKEIHMHIFKILAIQMFLHSCMLVTFCGQNAADPTSLSCCAEHLQEN